VGLLKGNYKLKKNIEKKELSQSEKLEAKFEKEASKRLGGSMVYIAKKKVNWNLSDK